MGSVDIPPFLREKQKEVIQKQKSGELPPFIKKKEEEGVGVTSSTPLETGVSPSGTQPQQPIGIVNQSFSTFDPYKLAKTDIKEVDKKSAEYVNAVNPNSTDPIKEFPQAKNVKESLARNQAIDFVVRSAVPDGFVAKQILQNPEIVNDVENETKKHLTAYALDAAKRYDDVVGELRNIKSDDPMGQQNIAADLRNAAIKSYAKENPVFRKDLQTQGLDLNDPDLERKLPQAKVGQLFNRYINQPEVKLFLEKENQSLAPAVDMAAQNLLKDNPEYAINQVANEVSQERLNKGLGRSFNAYYGKDKEEATNKIAEELYKDNPEKLAIYNNTIRNNQKDYIDDPSLLGGVAGGIKSTLSSIGKLVEQPFISNKEIAADKMAEEANAISANPKGFLKYANDVGHLTGFLMTLPAIEATTGLGGTNALTVATSGDIIEEARAKYPDKPLQATVSAMMNGLMYRAMGKNIFPTAKIGEALGEVKPEMNKIVDNLFSNKITADEARQQAATLVSKGIDLVKGTVAKDVVISAELTGLKAVNQVFDKITMSDEEYKQAHPEGELEQDFVHNLLLNAPIAGLAKYGEIKNDDRIITESIYQAASNPLQSLRDLDANTNLSHNELIEAKGNLIHAVKVKDELDKQGMPEAAQKDFIVQSLREKVANENAAKQTDSTLKKNQENIAQDANKAKEKILSGEITQPTLLTPEQVEVKLTEQIPEDKRTDAVSFVNEMAQGDIIPSTFKDAATANPLTFLQTVADQALGYTRDSEGNRVKSKDAVDPNVASQYSETVVDYAKQLFPEEATGFPRQAAEIKETGNIGDIKIVPNTGSIYETLLTGTGGFESGVKYVNPSELNLPKIGETEGDRRKVDALKSEISSGKKIEPAIIGIQKNGDMILLDGRHRAKAMAELGYDVPVIIHRESSTPSKEVADVVVAKDENLESVKSALADYENTKNTEADVADIVENLDIPELKDAVNKFREEQQYDKELAGRGDMDSANEALMAAVENYVKEKSTPQAKELIPEGEKPRIKSAGNVVLMDKESGQTTPVEITTDQIKEAPIPTPNPVQVGIHVEYPPTSLNYTGTGKLETEFGLDERQETVRKRDIYTIKEADQLLEDGWNVQDKITAVENGETHLSDAEYINLTRYGAELASRLRELKKSNTKGADFNQVLKELQRVAKVADLGGKESGRELSIRGRYKTVQDGTYEEFMLNEVAANKDAPLTENQIQTANKEYSELEGARLKLEQDQKAFEEEVAAFRAEKELKKIKKEVNKDPRRRREHLEKEREDLVAKIKEKWKSAGKKDGDVLRSSLPGITQLGTKINQIVEVAPDVLKLARNLVEDGFTSLKEITRIISDTVDMPEKDVHDIIAGEYRQKRETRTDAMIQFENLKKQAALINKLERAVKGEPQKERAKIKKNQDIEQFKKELGIDKLEQLESLKTKTENATQKLRDKLAKGDFAPEEKRTPIMQDAEVKKMFPERFKEVEKSLDEYIAAKRQTSKRLAQQMYENKSPEEKAVEVFSKALNVPRTIMASFDFSAPLRQGIIATIAHPKMASEALKFMFEAAKDEKVYNRWLEGVHKSPRWQIAEKTKLGITDPESLHVKEAEEAYQGAPYAEKIPIVGLGVKASERAYIGYLNHLRWNLFNMYADRFESGKNGGKNYENNPKLYEGLSSMINSMTGRGNIKGFEAAAPILNWFLFASKLIASRVNMLGLTDIPNLVVRGTTLGKYGVDYGFYSRLPKELRIEAAKDMLKFVAVGVTTLALFKHGFGADVEDDPRSSDFGKIKFGNTRWDIWGGFQPYARVLTQVISGQRKTSTTGKIQELNGKGFMAQTPLTPVGNFLRGKLAPVPSGVIDLASGTDAAGQPVTLSSALLSRVTPLLFQDIRDGMKDQGVKALFTVGVPSAFGISVQTYDPNSRKHKK